MVSNRELYEKVFCQYLEKGYDEDRADYIAAKVVNKQRQHLRGQQELVSAGWAPGNMDLGPLTNDGGNDDDAEKRDAQYNIQRKDPEFAFQDFNYRADHPRCVREQQKRRK